jgi:hypothetical protein
MKRIVFSEDLKDQIFEIFRVNDIVVFKGKEKNESFRKRVNRSILMKTVKWGSKLILKIFKFP